MFGNLAQTLHYSIRNNNLTTVQNVFRFSPLSVLDERDAEGRTAVQLACACGHLNIVRFLVESCSANLQAPGPQGSSALHLACCTGSLELVVYLIQTGRVQVDAPTSLGITSLHCCCDLGHISLVQYLVKVGHANLNASDFNGCTALMYACHNGNLELISFLLKSGVNVEATNTNGWTALYVATEANKLDVVRRLVEIGHANVEAMTDNGNTPLFVAAGLGHLPIVQYFAEMCKVNASVIDNEGDTSLHDAVCLGHFNVVQYLVEKCHVDTSIANKGNQTPYDIAVSKGHAHIAAYLQRHASSMNKNNHSTSPAPTPLMAVPGTTTATATEPHVHHATAVTQSTATAEPKPNNTSGSSSPSTPNSKTTVPPSPLLHDQSRMKAAVQGKLPTFAVSERYIQSILTDKELGRGFFGTVYRGMDRELGYSFAIKAINTEILTGGTVDEIQRTKQTFEKEQQTLSHFRHPNIAILYAYSFPTDIRGNYYLVYEIAEKGALDSFWRDDMKRLRLSFQRRVQIALDIMTALRFLHVGNEEKNVLSCFHRDIKSANIVLKQDLTAQLIDCGLAKFVVDKKEESASSTTPKGTPGYICPAYGDGEIKMFDCACDVYSFGVVLIELWTGRLQNHDDSDGSCFNFTAQYIKLKKGKTKRDLLADADSTFGFEPSDTLPDYMVRFVELAKSCMDDHEDIPHGKDVMQELVAIRQACALEEDGAVLEPEISFEPDPIARDLCERCQSFRRMPDKAICRMCWDPEQQRDNFDKIFSLLQTFENKLNAIGTEAQAANNKLNEIGTETNAANAKLDATLAETNAANTKLNAITPVLGNLDARFTNMVPRLFYIVPAEKKNAFRHPREYLKGKTATKYYLYFVCSHTKCLVDAPIKIRLTKDWVKTAAPVLAVSLQVLRCGLSVAGVPINLDGFAFDVTTAAVSGMLAEVTSIMAESGSHSDLLRRLQSQQPVDAIDVPELHGEAYKLMVEKATEQSAWRDHMEPVRTPNDPTTVWVTKSVARNPSLGYIKAR